jgi:hypothetical protein
MTRWTDFVKAFAKKHNLSYGCSLSDKRCSEEYKQYKIPKLTAKEKRESKQMGMEDINRAGDPFRNPEKEELRLMSMEDINRAMKPKKKKVKKIIPIFEASPSPPSSPKPSPPSSPKPSPKSTYTEYQLKNMYVKDLRELVKKLGLKLSYADVKNELITQILNHTQDTTSERAKTIVHKKDIVNTLYPSKRYNELFDMKLDKLKILARGYKIPFKNADKDEIIRLILRRENIGLVPRAKYYTPTTQEEYRRRIEMYKMIGQDPLLQKKRNQEREQMGMEDKPLRYIPLEVEYQNIIRGFNPETATKQEFRDKYLRLKDLSYKSFGYDDNLVSNAHTKLGHKFIRRFGLEAFKALK